MKSFVYLNIMPCSQVKLNRRFGRRYHVHHQDRRANQARNQHEAQPSAAVRTSDTRICTRFLLSKEDVCMNFCLKLKK
jgi:hypothetical protein